MQTASIILGLAALGGLVLASTRISGMLRPPMWLALGHGLIAMIGLSTLIFAAISDGIPTLANYALGILVVAALGGLALFVGFHLRRQPLPIPLVIIHGLIALTGYVMLLFCLRGYPIQY